MSNSSKSSPISVLASYLALAGSYLRLNLAAQLQYRGAFVLQVLAMFINDMVWVAFWVLFFTRFPVLRGWGVADVITIWAVVAAGFGLAHSACANALYLPSLISRGQLDAWMLYPRALLSHVLLGKMSASSIGDALFGFVVYAAFVQPDVVHFLLFTFLAFSVAILFVGFSVITGSLAFFLGSAEVLAEQWRFSLITFSTYPMTLFDGPVKIALFTVIPAAFASYLPVMALRNLSLVDAGLALAGSLVTMAIGVAVFYTGLRRYESGNLAEMRG